MAGLRPAFAYTVVYVKDVAESVEFYAKAFGYEIRRLDESHRWGELEAGQTTIAFTPARQHETDALTGVVHRAASAGERPPLELCFVYADVDAAYQVTHPSPPTPSHPSPTSGPFFLCSYAPLSLRRSGRWRTGRRR